MVAVAMGTGWGNKLGSWLSWGMSSGYKLCSFPSFFATSCCTVYSLCIYAFLLAELQHLNC